MGAEKILLALIRREICTDASDNRTPLWFTLESLEQLCALAAMHDLAHITGQALKKLGYLGEDPVSQTMVQQVKAAVYRYLRLDITYGQIVEGLEKSKIPFIPLKGTVLRQYYPEPWMRTSCDIDVLVQEEQLDEAVKVLSETLSCRCGQKGDHDIVLHAAGGVLIELHYDTIQERYAVNECRKVLGRIWEDAQPDEPGSCAYHMSDEMFYFYHMAHMAKHFGNGGCGVRSFLDVWILNHRVLHDRESREALLREGGLLAFAQGAEKLSEVWFSGAESDGLTDAISDYILRAGVYGNNENRAAVGQARMGGRLKYLLLRRVFMPYDYLKAEYPILKKHKWLTPIYQVVRWVRMLTGGYLGQALRELRANAQTSKEQNLSTAQLLKQLGL